MHVGGWAAGAGSAQRAVQAQPAPACSKRPTALHAPDSNTHAPLAPPLTRISTTCIGAEPNPFTLTVSTRAAAGSSTRSHAPAVPAGVPAGRLTSAPV